ncbi:MAG TPA: flagellar biosynthetic protein FliO [Permianibacter sp.]|nr:flagellar biosynthetic protein FliO [Permianibacter sp.]
MNASRNFANAGGLLLSLSAGSALAQTAEAVEATTAVPSVGRLLLGLLAVLALLMLCAWLVRRGGLTGQSGVIKVVSQTPVGTRERVVLIQVGEQQLLIGVTAQQISLLHTLQEPVAPATASVAGGRFAEQLAQLMKGQRPS